MVFSLAGNPLPPSKCYPRTRPLPIHHNIMVICIIPAARCEHQEPPNHPKVMVNSTPKDCSLRALATYNSPLPLCSTLPTPLSISNSLEHSLVNFHKSKIFTHTWVFLWAGKKPYRENHAPEKLYNYRLLIHIRLECCPPLVEYLN